MPRRFAVALAAALLAPLLACAQPLVNATELAARLADPSLRVLDIRDGKNADGKTAFDVGHIPGALSAPYARWRGPKDNPGKLPSNEELTALVRSLGIARSTPVVIVYEGKDATDFGAAARVYWTLKAAGVERLSILNGGFNAWRGAEEPIATDLRAVAPSTFTVALDPALIATREEVAAAGANGEAVLLDARPAAFFRGETRHAAARMPGTLVSAKNVSHAVWFAPNSAALRPAADLRRIAESHGVRTDQPTVSFCNTGHWAATNWFVLSEVLGQRDVKLYPESMVAWSSAGLPMANVPTRLQQVWLQLKEAAGQL